MPLTLYVGSKRYSSWSLRPYLALVHAGAVFETKTILLDRETTKHELAKVGPSGHVPVLHHDGLVVWDSLAICEYANELYPQAGLWPAAREDRARARAIAAEMHSGFAALRRDMPMDACAAKPGHGHSAEALADVRRITSIWRERLSAGGGPFLFGSFTIADAMFAPVATRFRGYGVDLDATAAGYVERLFALPAMNQWLRDAEAEPKTRE
ncbi:MAG: glutathione S-transferase N-terminal domain-containing protein [Kofleriaceae bacterium]